MERIQSAIDKARAARRDRLPGASNSSEAVVLQANPVLSPSSSANDLWLALPEFEANPKTLEAHRIVAFKSGPAAIPFDVMRTKLLHQMRLNSWRRIAITSPGSACGKTMVSLNLAFSLARQVEIRVLVVELDLRRPAIAKTLGLRVKHLFASVLEGKAPAEENMVRYGANLIFATNHIPTRSPAELLQGPGAAAVLDEIEARYRPDIMIFDMPPMLVNDDCAMLIGAAETSTIDEIDRCEQELAARTKVMGVVLNKCRYLERGESYGYDS
jgi:Mrp family chromosome partitioning ATPase